MTSVRTGYISWIPFLFNPNNFSVYDLIFPSCSSSCPTSCFHRHSAADGPRSNPSVCTCCLLAFCVSFHLLSHSCSSWEARPGTVCRGLGLGVFLRLTITTGWLRDWVEGASMPVQTVENSLCEPPSLPLCICCSLELCLIQWAKNEACKRLIKSWKKAIEDFLWLLSLVMSCEIPLVVI